MDIFAYYYNMLGVTYWLSWRYNGDIMEIWEYYQIAAFVFNGK
jgi:hypothetical protein